MAAVDRHKPSFPWTLSPKRTPLNLNVWNTSWNSRSFLSYFLNIFLSAEIPAYNWILNSLNFDLIVCCVFGDASTQAFHLLWCLPLLWLCMQPGTQETLPPTWWEGRGWRPWRGRRCGRGSGWRRASGCWSWRRPAGAGTGTAAWWPRAEGAGSAARTRTRTHTKGALVQYAGPQASIAAVLWSQPRSD